MASNSTNANSESSRCSVRKKTTTNPDGTRCIRWITTTTTPSRGTVTKTTTEHLPSLPNVRYETSTLPDGTAVRKKITTVVFPGGRKEVKVEQETIDSKSQQTSDSHPRHEGIETVEDDELSSPPAPEVCAGEAYASKLKKSPNESNQKKRAKTLEIIDDNDLPPRPPSVGAEYEHGEGDSVMNSKKKTLVSYQTEDTKPSKVNDAFVMPVSAPREYDVEAPPSAPSFSSMPPNGSGTSGARRTIGLEVIDDDDAPPEPTNNEHGGKYDLKGKKIAAKANARLPVCSSQGHSYSKPELSNDNDAPPLPPGAYGVSDAVHEAKKAHISTDISGTDLKPSAEHQSAVIFNPVERVGGSFSDESNRRAGPDIFRPEYNDYVVPEATVVQPSTGLRDSQEQSPVSMSMSNQQRDQQQHFLDTDAAPMEERHQDYGLVSMPMDPEIEGKHPDETLIGQHQQKGDPEQPLPPGQPDVVLAVPLPGYNRKWLKVGMGMLVIVVVVLAIVMGVVFSKPPDPATATSSTSVASTSTPVTTTSTTTPPFDATDQETSEADIAGPTVYTPPDWDFKHCTGISNDTQMCVTAECTFEADCDCDVYTMDIVTRNITGVCSFCRICGGETFDFEADCTNLGYERGYCAQQDNNTSTSTTTTAPPVTYSPPDSYGVRYCMDLSTVEMCFAGECINDAACQCDLYALDLATEEFVGLCNYCRVCPDGSFEADCNNVGAGEVDCTGAVSYSDNL